MKNAIEVRLADLLTAGVKTRAGNRPEAVREYASILQDGGTLDAGVAFRDPDGKLWLAAGHHRKAAYESAGRPTMPCMVKEGGKWEAIEFGIQDNQKHRGERLTRQDREHNIRLVLSEKPAMSDRAIAGLCGVAPSTVGKYRGQIGQSHDRVGEDGRVYDVTNLASSPGAQPTSEPTGAEDHGVEPSEGDRCECGAPWESDGDGGHCPNCGQSHPTTPSLPNDLEDAVEPGHDEFLDRVETDGAGRPTKLVNVEDVFKSLGRLMRFVGELAEQYPGPWYAQVMALLNKANDLLTDLHETEFRIGLEETA